MGEPQTCAECNQSGTDGKSDEDDGKWYCRTCWAAFGVDLPIANHKAATNPDTKTRDVADLLTCAECSKSGTDGKNDEDDGEWYCRACWAAFGVDLPIANHKAAADPETKTKEVEDVWCPGRFRLYPGRPLVVKQSSWKSRDEWLVDYKVE